jgi:hypothetical protein
VRKSWQVAAAAAAMIALCRAGIAQAADVGAMEVVRQTVYGVPPDGRQAAKRKGDAVVFQEVLETRDQSSALIRFIDDSKLTLGAKSKVVIDSFVFDPENTKGNALIEISVGTLRFVTGEMPKGGVVIKTPTATLTLRGTDVVVHVHPDGTTDTTVHDGKVEAQNNLTNEVTNLVPGDGATLGQGGTTSFGHDDDPDDSINTGNDQSNSPPEHRRSESPKGSEATRSESSSGNNSDDGGGDDDGGCNCI